jgi:hypothetical protein
MVSDPIFVIGAPRSGTSMLYYLLAAHPSLAYPDIGSRRVLRSRWARLLERLGKPVLADPALHARHLPRPGETKYEPGLSFLGLDPVLPQEGDFLWRDVAEGLGVPVQDVSVALVRAHPRLAGRIRRRYESIAARFGRPRIVDKAPVYTMMLDVLREMFPDAWIVHIVRDGRAVANSISYGHKYGGRNGWWGVRPPGWQRLERAGPVERACHQWSQLVLEARRAAELFPGRYVEARYEDLVGSTRAGIAALFSFLRLTPFGEALYPERLENRDYKWRATSGSPFGDPIWTDRAAIDPAEYVHFELMRPLLEASGYVERGASLAPEPS